MMKFFTLFVAVTVTSAALAEVTVQRYSREYRDSEFGHATSAGDLRTILLGNPFELDDESLAATLLPRLGTAIPGGVRFTTAPSDRTGYVAILAFDPPSGVPLAGVCANPGSLGTDRRPGRLRMLAALCRDGTPLALTQGELASVTGPNDPALLDLARGLVRGLAPRWARQNPHQTRP